ncbi:extracellular solute-binding protein [Faecalicatena orotica]|uniref:Carbohydrate ABC transporter substrate-binding protein (CUT1 family) n=1 Tax=Faecalicatena orotica TaxID=1544 RepID=A0A2Y9CAN4_9FIRM|nr:sugar ABC transporter substrate-binding protein [Faecalicatena orotica]PWJ22938.1 carbohydrate ABC transporter substrate-binding protein (CUT1 family) [Faecalicatena orotica]SSA58074.1 carbohydrate ABC transporter substrate-binding protein, CUT1 family [Faecalicatena orotica]
MKKRTKKIMSLLLAGAMVVSLAGCGKSGGSDSSKDSDSKGSGVAEITFWDMPWGPAEYQNVAEKLVDQFNEEHKDTIKVKYQSIPWDGCFNAFNVAIESGADLDVSTGSAYQPHQFAEMDEILPMDDVVKAFEEEGKLDDFVDGSLDQFQMDGQQVAMPWNIDPKGIYYNKEMLDAAGLTAPTTWDEFYDCCKALTKDGVYGLALAGNNPWQLEALMFDNGGSYIDEDKQANFDTPQTKEALEFLRKLKDVCAPGSAGYKRDEAVKLFMQEKAAFIVMSADFSVEIKNQSDEFYDKCEVLEPLTSPEGIQRGMMGMNGIMGYKQTKHPEEVKTFIKWWIENSDVLWEEGQMGPFPSRKSQMELSSIADNKFKQVFAESIIPVGVPLNFPHKGAFPAVNVIEGEELGAEASSTVLGTDTPIDEITSTINDKIQTILEANE